MTRGYFDFLQREPAYAGARKDWYVELISSTCLWYDLILQAHDEFDTKSSIRAYLKMLKQNVNANIEKRFIYFLAARKKVRFCLSKKPRYSWFGSELFLYIEVGRDKRRQRLSVIIRDPQTDLPTKPEIQLSACFISIAFSPSQKVSMPIHDFLDFCGIEIGVNTEVHYVGYTKNPEDRAILGEHGGLTRMLHKVSNEDYDFFVFYNLFKVSALGSITPSFNFAIANSMVDEVSVDEEGRLLEKALIKYFGTSIQKVNKKREESELANTLERLVDRNNIGAVAIQLEMDEPSELYRFFSRKVMPKDRHLFTCRMGESEVEIVEGVQFTNATLAQGDESHQK